MKVKELLENNPTSSFELMTPMGYVKLTQNSANELLQGESICGHSGSGDTLCEISAEELLSQELDEPNIRNGIVYAITHNAREELKINSADQINENKSLFYEDMPKCIELLYNLNEHFGGEPLDFTYWLQSSYGINSDFEERTIDVANQICNSFYEVENQCGYTIAQKEYDSQVAILPNEIVEVGKYLFIGGDIDEVKQHLDDGKLMHHRTFDEMTEFVDALQTKEEPTLSM